MPTLAQLLRPRRLVATAALCAAAAAWYQKGEVLRKKSDSSDKPFMSEWNFVRTFVSFFTSALRKSVRLEQSAMPTACMWLEAAAHATVKISDFALVRAASIPDLAATA